MVEVSALDQLEYYLASLDELGEILIDADQSASVSKGVLRLALGTIMASKGAIFLYKQESDQISVLASQGLKKQNSFASPKKLVSQSSKYKNTHLTLDKKQSWITGELKKSTKEGAQLSKMEAQKQKMFDAIHHPKLLFKQIEFEKAMKHGFLNMGIVYNTLQISNKGGQ